MNAAMVLINNMFKNVKRFLKKKTSNKKEALDG